MAAITMRNIVKKYGDGFPAVNDVSLDIADGEFVILVGQDPLIYMLSSSPLPEGVCELDFAGGLRRAVSYSCGC